MSGRFRKKPVVIEATQWNYGVSGWPRDEASLPNWMHHAIADNKIFTLGVRNGSYVRTLEGNMRIDDGDWIIRGVKGELYPCRRDIFEMTYEPVE